MEKYRSSISEQTLSRYLREMGYRKLSARPRHYAQNREAVAEFKKLLGEARQQTIGAARPKHRLKLHLRRHLARARGRRRGSIHGAAAP